MDTKDFVFLVKEKHNEVFPIDIRKVRMQNHTRIDRATDLPLITIGSAFSDEADTINGYAVFPHCGCYILVEKP